MKGLSETGSGQYRSKSSCSFCRSTDHQVNQCPHVEPIWNSLEQGIIPLSYMQEIVNSATQRYNPFNYYVHGDNWGDLFKQTAKAHSKVEAYQERQRQKALNKGKKTRRAKTCGYCGGVGHTRRTRGLLASHKTKLEKANRNFRKWVYRELVEKQGLSTGAIVKLGVFQTGSGLYSQDKRSVIQTLVTDVNWDSMNLFALMKKAEINWNTAHSTGVGYDRLRNVANFFISAVLLKTPSGAFVKAGYELTRRYGSQWQDGDAIGVPLPLGIENSNVETTYPRVCGFDDFEHIGYRSPQIASFEIVSRAPQVLSDDWIDGYSDEMAVIFKKFTQTELEAVGVLDHIKHWAELEIED